MWSRTNLVKNYVNVFANTQVGLNLSTATYHTAYTIVSWKLSANWINNGASGSVWVMLHSSGTFCSTWAGRLQPRRLALWWRSFCFRYSVRAPGLWQYGWYVVTRAWEISQAYEVARGICRFCSTLRLNWYKNSDLRSEVGTGTSLNSTTRCPNRVHGTTD